MDLAKIFNELRRSINTGEIFSLSEEKLQQYVTAISQPQAFSHFGKAEFPNVCETARLALSQRHTEATAAKNAIQPTDAELELSILRRYVEHYDSVGTDAPNCVREQAMKEVISSVIGRSADEVIVKRWHARLAPRSPPYPSGVLRPCGDSTINATDHKYHARAFVEPGSAPAWDQIRKLEVHHPYQTKPAKDREQKFGILHSLGQAALDFEEYSIGLHGETGIGVIFLDIDNFKRLNTQFTEVVVDRDILAPFQRTLSTICSHRGAAYRYGGEEFLILLPNQTDSEIASFAERLRLQIASTEFVVGDDREKITISIGVALFPKNGETLDDLIGKANKAEHLAKDNGKNRVVFHTQSGS